MRSNPFMSKRGFVLSKELCMELVTLNVIRPLYN